VVKGNDERKVGKPYISFDSFRLALTNSSAEICGIVNSDIFLFADHGFYDFIGENALKGLIFGSRIDVDSMHDRDGRLYVHGFDYFFFNKSLLHMYPPSEFCLGVPWWDYWVPLVPLLKGCHCYELLSPVAFHIKHDTHWNKNTFIDLGKCFAAALQELSPQKSISEALDNFISDNDMFIFALDVLGYILKNTDKMTYPYKNTIDKRIEVGRFQYLDIREGFIERHKRCKELEKQIDDFYSASFFLRHAKLCLRWLRSNR
jgi:hypothetical protein